MKSTEIPPRLPQPSKNRIPRPARFREVWRTQPRVQVMSSRSSVTSLARRPRPAAQPKSFAMPPKPWTMRCPACDSKLRTFSVRSPSRSTSGLRGVATVDGNRNAGNEIRRRRRKKYGDSRKIVRSTPPAGRGASQYSLVKTLNLAPGSLCQLNVDPAWQNCIDLDVVFRPGDCQRFRQLDDS